MNRLIVAIAATLAVPAAAFSQNVILVTADGVRWREVFSGAEAALLGPNEQDARREFWREDPIERRRALMPFLWSHAGRRGRIWGNQDLGSAARVTNGLNFSYPGYQEILGGFPDPRIDSNGKVPNPNVSVLEWLNSRPGFKGRVAAFGNWDVLPFILNTDRSRLPVWFPSVDSDVQTHEAVMKYLREKKPRVLYVLYGETDNRGHEGRYGEYLRAIKRVDDFLREIWSAVQSMPEYRGRTALVVTTDHGRGEGPRWTDHYKDVPGSENMWIATMGRGAGWGGEVCDEDATQAQVASTVAALAGEDYRADQPKAAQALDLDYAPVYDARAARGGTDAARRTVERAAAVKLPW
ncbi:MAG: alkaline phosphatase family protein [Elusimicrobia bacterium]|nr:alkaline phosphatase family protein [Elusimicrobiota bacterium]